jgi:hypothetical protein
MNDELERMWKKATMSSFKVLSRHFPGKTEETHEKPVRIAGLQADI